MGGTEVRATVTGPRQDHQKSGTNKDRGTIETGFFISPFAPVDRKNSSRFDKRSKETQALLIHLFESIVILDQLPRSSIQINITVIDSDGSLQAATINAAVLALVSAGIPMKSLVSACEVSLIDDEILLDPTQDETYFASGTLLTGHVTHSNDIALMESTGQIPHDTLTSMLAQAHQGCEQITDFMEKALQTYAESLSGVR
ncbi:putative Exosome complex component RRP41 like protein [Blattamonas nauphoetae]|uniref:Exosome complex component RRP41 like protein n=1 Tax=Blattamonas nauphoetae TaxID=2049346 RepID=A0ABQ9Y3Y3_9EUKA|nr:putative Exosome complex component RRP41 like protein [Blattamonas nauphoetae]